MNISEAVSDIDLSSAKSVMRRDDAFKAANARKSRVELATVDTVGAIYELQDLVAEENERSTLVLRTVEKLLSHVQDTEKLRITNDLKKAKIEKTRFYLLLFTSILTLSFSVIQFVLS